MRCPDIFTSSAIIVTRLKASQENIKTRFSHDYQEHKLMLSMNI
jgi:hypothetical protein